MATLASSGAISIGTLNSFFSGSGTSMSNFYRGGARVPSTRIVAITVSEGPFYQQVVYDWAVEYGFGTRAYWAGTYLGALVSDFDSTSFTSGSTTYFRGAFQVQTTISEVTIDHYAIRREYPGTTTQAINTGVPSSGTISLSNFYGAVNS
jgi:hypothetical protein